VIAGGDEVIARESSGLRQSRSRPAALSRSTTVSSFCPTMSRSFGKLPATSTVSLGGGQAFGFVEY